jgi:hypothetical protein
MLGYWSSDFRLPSSVSDINFVTIFAEKAKMSPKPNSISIFVQH